MKALSCLAIALVLSIAVSAEAEVHRLKPSQSAQHIQEIFDQAQPGDSVVFERGVYRTQSALRLKGKRDLEIRGQGRVEIVLNNLEEAVVELESCQNIRISGLRARHEDPAPEYQCEGAVIEVRNSEQIAISGCELNGCGAAGVYASRVRDLVVYDNKIFNNSFAGVWVQDTSGHVYRNRMYRNASDFITYGECDVVLSGNQIERNDGNSYSRGEFFRSVVRGR